MPEPSGGSSPPAPRRWSERPLAQLTLVRVREFVREPEAVFWTFMFPVLMTAGLGIAFRSKPEETVKVAVLAGGSAAADAAARLRRDPHLSVQLLDDSAAARALRGGKVALVLATHAGDGDLVEFRYDDTRPEGVAARRLVDDVLQRQAGRRDPVPVRDLAIRERGSRYVDFVVPGLLGMNLLGSGIWGIGFAVVDARRKRLLKRLVATPMPKAAYLASFILSRIALLVLEAGALLAFGALVFGVPMRGSFGALALICVVSSLAFGGLGLLIAARPRTIEAASGLMNLTMVPMWVFSGIFFSSSRFPDLIQPFVQALPLTAVNNALRANLLEGATLAQVAPELAIVAAWLVASFAIALRIFRWQ
ncbi:MAG TPA: ABC transporter permease [Gemmatimonadales bacterium]|jgi:ABC-type polysaccharide/polyol phosphate export permease|nr:ABC transporter permease [Gemmatimonadales bacterium]